MLEWYEPMTIQNIRQLFKNETLNRYIDYIIRINDSGEHKIDDDFTDNLIINLVNNLTKRIDSFISSHEKEFNLLDQYQEFKFYEQGSQSIKNILSLLLREEHNEKINSHKKYIQYVVSRTIIQDEAEQLSELDLIPNYIEYSQIKHRLDIIIKKFNSLSQWENSHLFKKPYLVGETFMSLSEEFDEKYYDFIIKIFNSKYQNLQQQYSHYQKN